MLQKKIWNRCIWEGLKKLHGKCLLWKNFMDFQRFSIKMNSSFNSIFPLTFWSTLCISSKILVHQWLFLYLVYSFTPTPCFTGISLLLLTYSCLSLQGQNKINTKASSDTLSYCLSLLLVLAKILLAKNSFHSQSISLLTFTSQPIEIYLQDSYNPVDHQIH